MNLKKTYIIKIRNGKYLKRNYSSKKRLLSIYTLESRYIRLLGESNNIYLRINKSENFFYIYYISIKYISRYFIKRLKYQKENINIKNISLFDKKYFNYLLYFIENFYFIIKIGNLDELTKLLTRRLINQKIIKEVKKYHIEEHSFGILLLDINNFKYYNDNMGHVIGDKILIVIAKILKKEVSVKGIVGRFGGDEFCIILPNTLREDINKIGWNIKDKIRLCHIKYMKKKICISLTVSIGMLLYPYDLNKVNDNLLNSLTEKTDNFLYSDKKLLL